MKLKLYIALTFVLFGYTITQAQIGINNPNPDPSAILDLKSDSSGLLVPRMTAFSRRALTNPANSLMVFDEDDALFFFYDNNYSDAAARWTGLGAWRFRDDLSDFSIDGYYLRNIYSHYTVKNVGLGTQNPTHKLDVIGNVSIGDSSKVVDENSLYVKGSITSGEAIETTDTVRANVVEGYGTVPLGTIVMWSGSATNVPDGWTLCDGTTGYTDHFGVARTVPNLQGRFIVGSGRASGAGAGATTYTVGNQGGEETHTLTINEMPSHNHGGITSSDGAHTHPYKDKSVSREKVNGSNFDNQGIDGVPDDDRTTSSAGAHDHTIDSQGDGQAHENRPPYYALAYIIRVK